MRMLAKHYCCTEKTCWRSVSLQKHFFFCDHLVRWTATPPSCQHFEPVPGLANLGIVHLALISLTGWPSERCLRTFGWFGKHQQEICTSASVASNVRVAATETSLTNWLWQTMVLRNIICFQKWFHSNCQFRLVVSWRLDSCLAFAGICRA